MRNRTGAKPDAAVPFAWIAAALVWDAAVRDDPNPKTCRTCLTARPVEELALTTFFCGNCGTALGADARFCGICGQATGSASRTASQAAPTSVLPVPPPEQAQQNPHAPAYGTPAAAPPSSSSHAVPSAAPSQTSGPYPGHSQYPGQGTAPPGVPWPSQREPRTGGGVDAFIGGDWVGAALAAGAAVASMIVLALAALVLADASQAGAHAVLSLTAMLVCAAFGGDLFAREVSQFVDSDSGSMSGNDSLAALPLTLTLVGCSVLAIIFLRRTRGAGVRDVLFQVVRTSLALAVITLVLALVSRFHSGNDAGVLNIEGSVGASVPSSITGAVLFSVAALGIALFLGRPTALPPRLQTLRGATRPGLIGAAAVFVAGLLAALGGLVYGLSTHNEQSLQIAYGLLTLPNVALGAVLLTTGVPLAGHGNFQNLGNEFGSGGDSLTLLTLTERSAWWWAAPVTLALTLVAVTVTLVVRQQSLPDARREVLRFAGCYALVAFVAALLLRVSLNGGDGWVDEKIVGKGSLEFNPLIAAIVAALWGLAAAVLAPQLATATGAGFVQAVRRRFGVGPRLTSQQHGGQHYGGQHYGGQPGAPQYAPPTAPQYGGQQYAPPPAPAHGQPQPGQQPQSPYAGPPT